MKYPIRKLGSGLAAASLLVSIWPGPVHAAVPVGVAVSLAPTPYFVKPGDPVSNLVTYDSQPSSAGTSLSVSLQSGATPIATAQVSGTDGTAMQTTVPVTIPLGTADQTLDVTATVTNADGSATGTAAGAVIVDGSAPSASLSTPAAGTVVSGTAVALAGAVDDANIAGWTLDAADGANNTSGPFTTIASGTGKVSGSLGTWDSTTVPDGNITLRLQVTDKAGNATTGYTTVLSDNGAPLAMIDAPRIGDRVQGDVTITGTADDNAFKDWTLEYAPTGTVAWTQMATGTTPVIGTTVHTWDTRAITDGDYDVRLTVRDVSDRSTVATTSISVSNAVITANIATPTANGTILAALDITGTAAGQTLDHYALEYAQRGQNTWHKFAEGTTAVADGVLGRFVPEGIPDGNYDIRLQVFPTTGVPVSHTVPVVLDASGPTVAIASPTNQGAVTGGVVAVVGTVQDEQLSSWKLESSPAGANAWTTVASGIAAVDNATLGTWNTRNLAAGSRHDLRLTAVDKTNHEGQVAIQVGVDAVIPTAAISLPSDGAVVNGTIAVQGTAADESSLTEWKLTYASVSGGSTPITIQSGTTPVNNEVLTSWNTSTVTDGAYKLVLTVKDAAGNTKQATRNVRIENQSPEVRVISPRPGGYLRGTVGVSYEIARALYPKDEVVVKSLATGQTVSLTSSSWKTTDFADGEYELSVTATNSAGITAIARTTVFVDNNAPSLYGQMAQVEAWITQPGKSLSVTASITDRNLDTASLVLYSEAGTKAIEVDALVSGAATDLSLPNSLPDGKYRLALRATDSAGNTAEVTLKEFGVEFRSPVAPVLATIDSTARQPVTLNWSGMPGSAASGIKQYRILKSRDGGTFYEVKTTSLTAWTDDNVADGKTSYKIELVAVSGSTVSSNVVTTAYRTQLPVFAVTPPPAVLTTGEITLTWQSVAGAVSYDVYRNGPGVRLLIGRDLRQPRFVDVPPKGAVFTYDVVAKDEIGNQTTATSSRTVVPTGDVQQKPLNGSPVLVAVDNRLVGGEVQAFVRDNRTMVPLRFVTESLGAKVEWDHANWTVTVNGRDGRVLKIKPGDSYFTVRDVQGMTQTVQMDAPSFMEYERTYVPMRFLSEALGFTVTWDQEANLAQVFTLK